MTLTSPRASIIILTHNNLNLTRQCVQSILEKTDLPEYEIILVDNASEDGTQVYLRHLAAQHAHIRLILNAVNHGFAHGNNQGAGSAEGEYLVFLNNDTVVTRGWLTGLIRHLQDPQVGVIGPVTNASGNETRIPVDYEHIRDMDAFAAGYTRDHQGKSFEISMLAFLCVAMRRPIYEEVGPLDERFGIGMFEDDDYALRIKAKGYSILCAQDVFIHHWGSASFSQLGKLEYWSLFRENLEKFEQKWGSKWLPSLQRMEFMRQQFRQFVDGLLWFNEKLAERDQQVEQLQARLSERDAQLAEINRSYSWRIARRIQRFADALIPLGSQRKRLVDGLLKPARIWKNWGSYSLLYLLAKRLVRVKFFQQLASGFSHMVPARVKRYYRDFRRDYPLIDRSKVTLFADPQILPDYTPRHDLIIDPPAASEKKKVTLISTLRNEAEHAHEWLDSIRFQSRIPDEIILTDGGSTDGTAEIIEEYARNHSLNIKLMRAPGANIAQGRNLAIQQASFPIIACTDFGCMLDRDWLRNLLLPFEVDEEIVVSAGYSQVIETDDFARLSKRYFFKDLGAVEPATFLPSSRSLGFMKTVWEQVDGYPEWLTDAGEDTYFNFSLKLLPGKWAFVPQAKVFWQGPTSLRKFYRTLFRYSRGDGEVGMFAPLYWAKAVEFLWRAATGAALLVLLVVAGIMIARFLPAGVLYAYIGLLAFIVLARLILWARRIMKVSQVGFASAFYAMSMRILVDIAQPLGFARGVATRPAVDARRTSRYTRQLEGILNAHPHRRGIIIYPPTHDWGFMFQRPHQLARAFADKGFLYFFATKNEKTDAVFGFHRVAPNLYLNHVPLETFKRIEQPIVILGSPWGRHTLDNFDRPRIIYDHYDEIEVFSANPQDHADLLEKAEIVLVTAERLKQEVLPHRPDLLYIPNGVDYKFIHAQRPTLASDIPQDLLPILDSRKPIVGYSGALAEWFDYDLFNTLSILRPDLEFVLIGVSYDGSLERSRILDAGLDNVHWLGMKPYEQLFHYVWHFDIGIIPFKINNLTLSTTPVKLFEYMACQLPVISTDLPESRRYPGTFIANDVQAFLQRLDEALKARHDPAYLELVDGVARENTWEQRVEGIIARLEAQDDPSPARGDMIPTRAATPL